MRFIPFLIVFLFLVPVFVFAVTASTYQSGGSRCVEYDSDISCSGTEDDDQCFPNYCLGSCQGLWDNQEFCSFKICCMVVKISRLLFAIAAGLAITIIIWAGIMYMTSTGDETRIKKAKQILLYGIIGTAIVAASGYIIAMVVEFLL